LLTGFLWYKEPRMSHGFRTARPRSPIPFTSHQSVEPLMAATKSTTPRKSATLLRIRYREYSGKPTKQRNKKRPKLETEVRKARQAQAKARTVAFNTALDEFLVNAKESISDIAISHSRSYEQVARRAGFLFTQKQAARKPSAWDGFCSSKSAELNACKFN
jgi:hypothetical protein